jgi:hypothetical protein
MPVELQEAITARAGCEETRPTQILPEIEQSCEEATYIS